MPSRDRPRLIATDLDGTLLRSDGTVSPRTRAALATAEDAGATVVFISGRPPRNLDVFADVVGPHGLAIGANGALVYDVRARKVLHEQGLPGEVALKVATLLRDELPGVAFALERGLLYCKEPLFQNRWPMPEGSLVAELDQLCGEPVAKLLARHEDMAPAEFVERGAQAIGDLATATYSDGHALLEISAFGVSKASALAAFCEQRGIEQHEVVAFGDMPNDLQMLEWAGTSYAMANAHPLVADVAKARCRSNDEDGVAQVLEGLFA